MIFGVSCEGNLHRIGSYLFVEMFIMAKISPPLSNWRSDSNDEIQTHVPLCVINYIGSIPCLIGEAITMVTLAPFIGLKKQEHTIGEIGPPVCTNDIDPYCIRDN